MKRAATTLLLCMSASGMVRAEDPVDRLSNNPAEGYTVIAMDGRQFVVDGISGTVFVTDGNGQVHEVPLQQAAMEAADGNTVLRDHIVTQLTDFTTNPAHAFTLTGSTTPRLATADRPSDGGGGTKIQRTKHHGKPYDETITTMSGSFGDDLGGPCDLSPCTPYSRIPDMRIYYSYDGHTSAIGGGSVGAQTDFVTDFEAWQRYRSGQCDAMRDAANQSYIAGGAMMAACPFSFTGVGAVGCAAAVVSYAYLANQVARYGEACATAYPGPGQW